MRSRNPCGATSSSASAVRLPEPRADPDNHASHAERRHGVQPAQPRDSQSHAQPRAADAQNDDERAPHVGGKMQRVGFQRVAGIFCQHPAQRFRAHHVNSHAQRQHQNRDQAGTYVNRVKYQPLKSFPDDVHRGEQQQRRFDERRKVFHFPVAVQMVRVGGLIRHAHRKVGNHRGDQVQTSSATPRTECPGCRCAAPETPSAIPAARPSPPKPAPPSVFRVSHVPKAQKPSRDYTLSGYCAGLRSSESPRR